MTANDSLRDGGGLEGANMLSTRKHIFRQLLEEGAPKFLYRGWRGLVKWDSPLFDPKVEFSFPFMDGNSGRLKLHCMLGMMHWVTPWNSLEAEMDQQLTITSPAPNTMVLVFLVKVPIERSKKPPVRQYIRIVLRFNESGLIDRWNETWTYSTEEVLEQVWNLDSSESEVTTVDMGDLLTGKVRENLSQFSDTSALPSDPEAAKLLRLRMSELVEFLAQNYARMLMKGHELNDAERLEQFYKYFSDDVELETPLMEFRGIRAMKWAMTASFIASNLVNKSLYMETITVNRQGPRVINCKYATRIESRFGRRTTFFTNSRFYIGLDGKIQKQVDEYSEDNTLDVTGQD